MMIELATLSDDIADCYEMLEVALTSGEVSGTSTVCDDSSDTCAIYTGTATSYDSDLSAVVFLSDSSDEQVTLSECTTVSTASRRLRQLTTTEAAEPSRHRRLSTNLDDPWKPVHEGCVIFHCFRGDRNCDEPSAADACVRWADDNQTCAEPLCKYVAAE